MIRGRFSSLVGRHVRHSSSVRIGCASGFWGDTATAVPQLLHKADNLDYIMFDYLSELTMSLLTASKQKNPDLGYAPDFVTHAVGPHLQDIQKKGVKIIANAGGINTSACVAALTAACKKAGVEGMKIAQVTGDNLMGGGCDVSNDVIAGCNGGVGLPKGVHSMTAYFGAGPIVKALEMGADIVVTGRTADSSMALAPCIHNLGWHPNEFDKLAMGSLAGHLIECGGQATGGLFTDWEEVPGYENLGFPIVEVSSDGTIEVTKPNETGGLLNKHTIAEQILYEIGDPSAYILPDVVCDFTQVDIQEIGDAKVQVKGAIGYAPTPTYKISSTYLDGFRGTCAAVIAGGRAAPKGRKVADAIMKRTDYILDQMKLGPFDRTYTSLIGAEDSFGSSARANNAREAVIWMAVQHRKKAAVEVWAREIASSGTGMAPGLCGMVGGRPKATPCLRLHSFLYPKDQVPAAVTVGDQTDTYTCPQFPESKSKTQPTAVLAGGSRTTMSGKETYTLEDLAFARSGDKGDSCNVGVIARHPAYLPYIKEAVTSQSVSDYFSHCFQDPGKAKVEVFDLPGFHAINLLLHNSLGGGGMASLRPDPLGKSFGQMLLSLELKGLPHLDEIVANYDKSSD